MGREYQYFLSQFMRDGELNIIVYIGGESPLRYIYYDHR